MDEAGIVFALALVGIAFIICMFLVWYFSNNARLKERLLLIEKGLNPDDFLKKTEPSGSPWLKIGIVVIGLSLGVAVTAKFFIQDDTYQIPTMGIFAGASLIVANYISKYKNR